MPFSEHVPLQQDGQFVQIRHSCPEGVHCSGAAASPAAAVGAAASIGGGV
jgi:hypothetical protein